MAVPPFQEFMLPFLEFISDGKEHHISELFEFLARRSSLSEHDQKELLPSGRETRFKKRVHWTRVHRVQAKLLDSTGRGRVRIINRGQQFLSTKPKQVDIKVLSQFPEVLAFWNRSNQKETAAQPNQESVSAQSPEELLEISHDLACKQLG